MSRTLLNLALTVEQHAAGHFYWVVLERDVEPLAYHRLVESGRACTGYDEALQEGCAALLRLSGGMRAQAARCSDARRRQASASTVAQT